MTSPTSGPSCPPVHQQKPQRGPSVLIGTPMMRGQVEQEFVFSILATRSNLFRRRIQHNVVSNETSVISYSRNAIAEKAGHDYLMWIDSDMKFPPYGVSRLIDRGKDIIGGVYYRKEADARPLVFKLNKDNLFETYDSFDQSGPFEVDAVGTGFLLIKRTVLEAFTPEYCAKAGYPFDMGRGPTGKEEGEDISFCRRAKELGFRIWADPTIPIGHVGRHVFTRQDFETATEFKKWREKKYPYTNDIDGWMTRMELNWLKNEAAKHKVVVEVGSWKGRSTHALLSGCKGTVFAVDTWDGSRAERHGAQREVLDTDIKAIFDKNVAGVGEADLRVLKMSSDLAAATFPEDSVDMVFIDAGHTYEEVLSDIRVWAPKARKVVCGHDYDNHEVQEAVTEYFGSVDTAETIWIKKLT